MKFFAYLFSACFILLSCLSCKDSENFAEYKKDRPVYSVLKNHGHQAQQDNCSPLCSCNCCGQSLLDLFIVQQFDFFQPDPVSKKKTLHSDEFISNYHQRIWQPPKLNPFYS
ncbi:DUF6660 family protein [Pedobacter sp. BMA]|uniref:DUF6660 family protein n=1 Tax=Pedobacter sp. BMA TaxID=1663685 RepID=UPI00064AD5A1|nr:hypothetical protein AB669_05180 [Pedobacter sp. BMA]